MYFCKEQIRNKMAEKSYFSHEVEPQDVDFTLRAKAPSLIMAALNAAGRDAHVKGFGVDELGTENRTWVLARMAIELDRRPLQYTPYRVETWISGYNRALSTRNFRLLDESGEAFARIVSQWAMLDIERRTSVDLSLLAAAHDRFVVDAPSPIDPPCRLRPLAGEAAATEEHRVRYGDIDFNRHVNTIRYIEMIFDCLPVEALAADRPFRFDIHFLHESTLGETLRIACEEQPEGFGFEIAAGEHVCVRASVRWK